MDRRASDSLRLTTEAKICSYISPPSNPTATAASPREKRLSSRSSKAATAGLRLSTSAVPTDPPSKAIGGEEAEGAVDLEAEAAAAVVEAVDTVLEAVVGTASTVVAEGAVVEADVGRETGAAEEGMVQAAAEGMAEEVVEVAIVAGSRGTWRGIAIRAAAAGGMEVAEVADLATTAVSRGISLENAPTAR